MSHLTAIAYTLTYAPRKTLAIQVHPDLHLMRAPKPCVDYVVIHELCHLVEHNHGKRFYALMDKVMPDWRVRRTRLNEVDIA